MRKNINRASKICIGISFVTSVALLTGCSDPQTNETAETTQMEEGTVDEEEANRLGISKELLAEVDQAVSAYSYIDSLNGQALSAEQVCSTEIEPYRSAIKYMNGIIQLDTVLARKIADQNLDEVENKITELLDADFDKYYEMSESESNDDNASDKKKIAERIDCYNMFNVILDEASGNFTKWLNVQNVPESGDRFTMCGDAWKVLYEACQNGRIGTKKAQAAIDLIIPDNIDKTNKNEISSYLMILKNYLADNGSGVSNFINISVQNGLMNGSASGGADIVEGTKIADFAEKLDLTEEVVRASFGEMEEYGSSFDWSMEPIDETKKYFVYISQKIDDLSKQIEEKKNTGEDVSELESQKNDCQNELNNIKEKMKEEN